MLSWIFATRYADVHAEILRERAMEAGQEIAELRTVVARLERRVQELTVQQAAIMKLMQARGGVSSAEVQEAIRAAANESVLAEAPLPSTKGAARTCHACGRTRSIHAKHCIYCGVMPSEPT